jgi:Prokaryotic membrane lipoprotein lipid attachment site
MKKLPIFIAFFALVLTSCQSENILPKNNSADFDKKEILEPREDVPQAITKQNLQETK